MEKIGLFLILLKEKWDNKDSYLKDVRFKVIVHKVKSFFVGISIFVLLFGISFIILYPLLYMLSVSFRVPEELFDPSVVWIPKTFTLDNIKAVWDITSYPSAFIRTMSLALLSTVCQCFTCSLVGYGFARFKFKGREVLFMGVLFTLIVPPQAITMPLYLNFVHFDFFGLGSIIQIFTGSKFDISIIDTIWPSTISAFFGLGIRAGLFIYIYRQFFRNMPLELEEAAYIDGCKPFKTYIRVMLPNTGPVALVTFLFSIVWYWNDFFYSALFFNKSRPLSVLVGNLAYILDTYRTDTGVALTFGQTLAYLQVACLLFILPLLIMYIFLQRYFTQSIVRAGIVG